VIAHVDHGKTTVCDALLAKAGLLNIKKAGTACAMDTTAEEQERGITIHSTAVSMSFDLDSSIRSVLEGRLAHRSTAASVPARARASTSAETNQEANHGQKAKTAAAPLYVGNLPFGVDKDRVATLVKDTDQGATVERFASKRGFAIVQPSAPSRAAALQALDGTTFQERVLTVSPVGMSARQRLEKFGVKASDIVRTQDGCAAILPDGLGLVSVPARVKGGIAAKEALAQRAVDFLQSFTERSQDEAQDEVQDQSSLRAEDGAAEDAEPHLRPRTATLERLTVNCIDSPGHVDFNGEVAAALRITDGALVVVDALDGPAVMTNTVLRQAIREGVRPVLLLNKVDRLFLEQQLSPPDVLRRFKTTIAEINHVIEVEQGSIRAERATDDVDSDASAMDWRVSLEDGTVAFGSGYFGWIEDVPTAIARLAARVVAMRADKKPEWARELSPACVVAHLRAKWFGPKTFDKSVCQHILRPLKQLHTLCQSQYTTDNSGGGTSVRDGTSGPTALKPALQELLHQQDLYHAAVKSAAGKGKEAWTETLEGKPRDLIRLIAGKLWCPAAAAIVKLIAIHLPSPVEAQRYRAPLLYRGAGMADNMLGHAIQTASDGVDAPLSVLVTKLTPLHSKAGGKPVLVALCRVLSGQVHVGQEVSVLGPEYEPPHALRGASEALSETSYEAGVSAATADHTVKRARVKRILRFRGCLAAEDVHKACVGTVVGLVGLEEVVLKTATLTSHPLPDDAHKVFGLRTLSFTVAPVVRVAVVAARAEHATALRVGLRTLQSCDPCVVIETDALTGEQVVAATGELHLDVCLNTLQEFVGSKVEIMASEPRLAYRESLEGSDAPASLAKSANKLNRVFIKASPLHSDLVEAIESGRLDPACTGPLELSKALVELGRFDKQHATQQRVWAFGPELGATCAGGGASVGSNVIVNSTVGIQGMDGIRSSVVSAFRRFCASTAQPRTTGAGLCGEQLQGVRFDIVDAKIHGDARHRSPAQLEPAVERALSASYLSANPTLLEPTYEVEVTAPTADLGALYNALAARGASDVSHTQTEQDVRVMGTLPVALANGLTEELRSLTGGRAFSSVKFAGFALCEGDCTQGDGRAASTVRAIRERKGLEPTLPAPTGLIEKL